VTAFAGVRKALDSIDRDSFVRAVLAIVGLFVAFVAALLSTVAADSGQFWPSVILATSSLLLAGVVGILTVPLLAKRVMASRVNDVLHYQITREGTVYLILVLVIGIAALNTGNNLLFVILATMLAAVVVSGVASAFMLRGLKLELTVPEHMFARAPALARVRVRNTRAFTPAMSVTVVSPEIKTSRSTWVLEKSTFSFPPRRFAGREWFRWPDLSLKRRVSREESMTILQQPVFLPYVPAKSSVSQEVELRFEKRGLYSQDALGVSSRFPFAFLQKTRMMRLDSEVIVFPSVDATDQFYEVLPLIAGEVTSFVRGRGFDLYRIREYSPQDDARHVDWKASAKSGDLKLREFTREDERKLRIVFDNPAPDAIAEMFYEAGVQLGASLAWHFASENTDLSFVAPGFEGRDLNEFLRYLALVKPEAAPGLLEELPDTGAYNVVITARPRGSITTALWSCSYVIFLGD